MISQYTTDLSESNLRKRLCTHFPLLWSSQSKPIVALGFQPITNVLCLQNISRFFKGPHVKILEASFSDTFLSFGILDRFQTTISDTVLNHD